MKRLITILVLLASGAAAYGQQVFSGGFRAGMTFSTISGPSETGNDGENLESYGLASGFHVGPTFNFRLSQLFGVRAELLYAQKGTNYDYGGPSFWIFEPTDGPPIYSLGARQMSLDVTNSYLELPLTAYARLGSFELSAGINTAILLGSRGFGELSFIDGRTTQGFAVEPFTINLEHRYNSDKYREKIATDFESRLIEGRAVDIPLTIGAYYEAVDNGKKLYRFLDLGVVGSLSYFLSSTLFIGGRVHYGLLDVTNNEQDISRRNLDANSNFILRDDMDRNLALYLSIGFSL